MAQPTGGTPTYSIFPTDHTRRAGDTFAIAFQSYNAGTGDGTMSYGADAMTAVADQEGPPFNNRWVELFSRVAPASGLQALTAGGTGTPRGIIVRTYDTTTNALVSGRTTSAVGETSTASLTRAAPNANDLGQLCLYYNSDSVTITGTSGCTQVGSTTQASGHTVALFDVTGANPSVTLSGDAGWIVFAYDVEGTSSGPTEYDATSTDGTVVADTPSQETEATPTAADGAVLADSASQEAEATPSAADGAALADTPAAAMEADASASDGAVLADTLSATVESESSFPEEGLVLADTPSAALEADSGASDGVRLADSAAIALDVAGEFDAGAADGAQLADSAAVAAEADATATDGLRLGDSASIELEAALSVADGIVLAEVRAISLDGGTTFRGWLRAALTTGPRVRANLTVNPSTSGGGTMLAADSTSYVQLADLVDGRTGDAITSDQVASATCSVYDRRGTTPLAGASALPMSTQADPFALYVLLPASLDPSTRTVDVKVRLTLTDDSVVEFWQRAVPVAPLDA